MKDPKGVTALIQAARGLYSDGDYASVIRLLLPLYSQQGLHQEQDEQGWNAQHHAYRSAARSTNGVWTYIDYFKPSLYL